MFNSFRRIPQPVWQMIIYGGGLICVKLFGVIMLPIFTNFLSTDDYAKLEILQTLANLLSIVLALGLAEAMFRFGGDSVAGRHQATAAALAMALMSCGLALAIGQMLAPMLTALLPGDVTVWQVRFLLGSLAFGPIIVVALSHFRLEERADFYLAGSVGWVFLQGAMSIIALYAMWGLNGILCAGFLSTLVAGTVLGWITYRRCGLRFGLADWGRLGHYGTVCAVAGVAAFMIDGFSRWVLASYVSSDEVAEFGLAAKVALMAAFAVQPHLMYWLPKRFVVLDEPDGFENSAQMAGFGMVLALLAAVGVMIAGPIAISSLTPTAYHGAIVYVPALALISSLAASTQLIQTGAMLPARTVWPAVIEWSTAAMAVAAYFLFIPAFGAWGTIAAFGGAVCLRFVAYTKGQIL